MSKSLNQLLKIFRNVNDYYKMLDLGLKIEKNYVLLVDYARPKCNLSFGFYRNYNMPLKDFGSLLISVAYWFNDHQKCNEESCLVAIRKAVK